MVSAYGRQIYLPGVLRLSGLFDASQPIMMRQNKTLSPVTRQY